MLQDFFAQSCADKIDFINPVNLNHYLMKGCVSRYKVINQGGLRLRDLVGNNHGVLTNMDTKSWAGAMGRPGGSGSLSYLAASSKYVNCGSGSSFLPANATICGWFNPSVTTRIDWVSQWAVNGSRRLVLLQGVTSAKWTVFGSTDGSTLANSGASTTAISPGTWYFVAGTWSSTTVSVYVNGILENSAASTGVLQAAYAGNLYLGNSQETNYASGNADDVMYFNRALSAAEVLALYNATSQQYDPTLNWIPSSSGVVPAAAGGTTTTTTAAPTTYHLTAAINSAIVVGPNNLSNTRHITANAQAAVAIGPSELLDTRHFTSIIAAAVAIGPNNLSNTRHITANAQADISCATPDLRNERHLTASIPAAVVVGNVDLRNTISFVASFAANVTIGPSSAINTRHLTASVQSEVVIGTCELFVTRHLTGLAQAITSFASVDLLVTRPFTANVNAEILFGNVTLSTDGEVYSNNPYVLLHNAIWDLFESDANFTNMFKVKNRIKFNSATNRDPRKERIQSADVPEIELVYDAEVINLTESNTGASLLVTYALMIESGDYRINEYINAIHWIMLCNLVQWRSTLTAITWKDKHPVKRINVVDVSHGESGTNRLQGFDSIWRCQIEMHFPVVDLVFN